LKKIPFFQVDAFTDVPFKGNPAAICILEKELPEDLMQQIAMENNLAETAFVTKASSGFNLRWFTPSVEIKLCGHATVATAHVLWQEGILDKSEVAAFHTLSGLLRVTKNDEWIQLDFPAFSFQPAVAEPGMLQSLGISPADTVFTHEGRFVFMLDNADDLMNVSPDFTSLKKYPMAVITSRPRQGSPYDFISRSFAPSHGVDEDPVTGSSHCVLAPYWSEKLHRNKLFAYQASQRGGELKLRLSDDRVLIEGKAITVIKGEMVI
jgi:PhzF family phenazine biosynthesis protein